MHSEESIAKQKSLNLNPSTLSAKIIHEFSMYHQYLIVQYSETNHQVYMIVTFKL